MTKYAVCFIAGIVLCLVIHYIVWSVSIFNNQNTQRQFNEIVFQRDQCLLLLSGNGIIKPVKDSGGKIIIADKEGKIVEKIEEQEYINRIKQSEQTKKESIENVDKP